MSNGQQPTGHLRWQQRTVHTEQDNYHVRRRYTPVSRTSFTAMRIFQDYIPT